MPNTPSPRPDVSGIEARADDIAHPVIRARSVADWAADIYALITWIEALEARQVKLEAVVKKARSLNVIQRDADLAIALAALGDGDG